MTSSTRLALTTQALLDVREILSYTQTQWGIAQRNAYFRELRIAADRLLAFPELGQVAGDGIREFSLRHHVVLYRYDSTSNTVTILRVMHQRRLRGR
jgi:plasmid stabilization system protein ParE